MWEVSFRIVVALLVLIFATTCLTVAKPISDGGRLSLKLCLFNAIGWLVILPLSDRGHPPPFVIALLPFWLLNLVLLPAAFIALRVSYKQHEERKTYLVIAGSYLALNVFVLFLIPAIWILGNPS